MNSRIFHHQRIVDSYRFVMVPLPEGAIPMKILMRLQMLQVVMLFVSSASLLFVWCVDFVYPEREFMLVDSRLVFAERKYYGSKTTIDFHLPVLNEITPFSEGALGFGSTSATIVVLILLFGFYILIMAFSLILYGGKRNTKKTLLLIR